MRWGSGGIYLNLKGREEQGIVAADEAEALKAALADGLTGLDRPRARAATWPSAASLPREAVYRGPYLAEAPDLLVDFAPGYRVSWSSSMGGVAEGQFEDNVKKWSGDHIIDPDQVPGVLFMNRPFRREAGAAAGPGPDDSGRPGRPQGPGDGRRVALVMKILVLGLDCAAPELLFGYDDLPNIRRLMEVGCLRPARERHPADHRARLDVPGDQPGPRLAGRLRLPQPGRPLLRRPGDRHRRDRSPSRPSGTSSPARGSGRSSSASRRAIPRGGSTGSPWAAS